MHITELKNEGLKREYKIVLPAADIDDALTVRLQELSKKVKIKGFRPGKVPLKMMKQRYGQRTLGEILETLVDRSTRHLLAEKKLIPAMRPHIDVQKFGENQDLEYCIDFEVYPDVPNYDYSNIKLKQLNVKVSDQDVEKALEKILATHKDWVAPENDRAAVLGDSVEIDYEGSIDGKLFEGGAAKGHRLELGSKQFIPGFEEQLVGSKKGQEVIVKVTFPENYYSKEMAGKEAQFKVTVHAVLEAKEATLSDELAKKLGYEDIEKLKVGIKEQIAKEFASIATLKMKKEMFDALDNHVKFEIPVSMLKIEHDSLINEMQKSQKDTEVSEKDKKDLEEIAARRVRLGILMAELARNNQILVTQEEIRQAVFEKARAYPGQEYKVLEFYQKNHEALDQLKGPILEEKVIKFLFDKMIDGQEEITVEQLVTFYESEND